MGGLMQSAHALSKMSGAPQGGAPAPELANAATTLPPGSNETAGAASFDDKWAQLKAQRTLDNPEGAFTNGSAPKLGSDESHEDPLSEEKPEPIRVAQNAAPGQALQGGEANVSNPTAPRTKSEAERELDKKPALKAILQRATGSRNVNLLWPIVYGYQESGWNPNNKTGSYKGIFQLDKDEFQELMKKGKVKQGANLFDPEQNIIGGIEKFIELHAYFVKKYQRETQPDRIVPES